jgi:hypothetical protein
MLVFVPAVVLLAHIPRVPSIVPTDLRVLTVDPPWLVVRGVASLVCRSEAFLTLEVK